MESAFYVIPEVAQRLSGIQEEQPVSGYLMEGSLRLCERPEELQ